MVTPKRFSKPAKAETPTRGRQQAAPVAKAPVRGRQTAEDTVPAESNAQPVRENRLAFIGNVWLNLRKDSNLTDAQVEKAYRFIDEVFLPNFYQKMTIDQAFGAQGVTLMAGDNIKLWQNNKREEINPRTGQQYQDADMRVSVALDNDFTQELTPEDYDY